MDWIAVSAGEYEDIVAGFTGSTVTQRNSAPSCPDSIDGPDAPHFLAWMQSMGGGDTSALRVRDLDSDAATLFVQEGSRATPRTAMRIRTSAGWP
ncbi:hypothetical protein FDP22_24260 (plasmid) [Paroceanicella profunda]|uniref:Uncharacterized protein n=1 Tax=Paroceanicella profunda TaxID=2579971 RepID=A0A5B8G2Z5_9RHOB|nr:hypothetical protein [Paroceanicella profunda]QDL94975.1 hypothetical protein FDP22_24260 [Paroceanicella profunda]